MKLFNMLNKNSGANCTCWQIGHCAVLGKRIEDES